MKKSSFDPVPLILIISAFFLTGCEVSVVSSSQTVNSIGQSSEETYLPPDIVINNPTTTVTVMPGYEVKGSWSDARGLAALYFYFSLTNGQNPTNFLLDVCDGCQGNFSWTVPPLPDNAYCFWVVAKNKKNVNKITGKTVIIVRNADRERPVLTILSPTNGQKVGHTYTLQGTASDNAGVARVWVSLDGAPFLPIAASGNWSTNFTVIEGWHTNFAYAEDTSANYSITDRLAVYYEAGVPAIIIQSPANGLMTREPSLQISGTASVDSGSIASVQLSVNGGAYFDAGGTGWNYAYTLSLQGTNVFIARAVSSWGKTNTSAPVCVVFDSVPPLAGITAPTNGQVFPVNSVSAAGSASDPGSGISNIYLVLDGGTPVGVGSSAQWSYSFAAVNGGHVLAVYAVDRCGNAGATNSIGFSIDGASNITVHAKGYSKIHFWNVTASPAISNTAWPGLVMQTGDCQWYRWVFSNASFANMVFNTAVINGYPGQTADLNRGPGEWWYKNSKWTAFNPDETNPPSVELTAPVSGATLTGTVLLTAAASDAESGIDRVEFYRDGNVRLGTAAVNPCQLQWNSAYCPNGEHTITAVAYDGAGNSNRSFGVSVSMSNPNLPPVCVVGGSAMSYVSNSVVFDASASYDPNGSIASYGWSFPGASGGASRSGPVATNFYCSQGSYTVTLTITDNEGASSSTNIDVTVNTNFRVTDFREETIYFVITTRFYDGDPGNNVHCWDESSTITYSESDPAWRGDFDGLIQKLDYIKALGFSAIWITPIVQNSSGLDYHGYHAINHKRVDYRYKSGQDATPEESYRRLIDAAHAKGMKIIQDIVLNHTGNFGEENLYELFRRNSAEPHSNALTRTDPWGRLPSNYDSLAPGSQYNARINAMEESNIDAGMIYHKEKSMSWESYSVQTGQIDGDCVDINTENPVVAQYLIDAYNHYIDMGVDAFRIDTVKHISRLTFNNFFLPAFKQRGGQNFFIFGEVCSRYRQVWNSGMPCISCPFYTWKESKSYPWGTREQNEASVYQNWQDNCTTAGQPVSCNYRLNGNDYHAPDWSMSSSLCAIDFPMHWNFNNASDAFGVAVGGDCFYSDATWNVTYVDSHDYAPDCAPENERFAGGQDTWAENLDLMFTFRGIPCIYYGSEIEFKKGMTIDPAKTKAAFENSGRAYFGPNLEGTVTATGFGQYAATGTVANTLNYPLAQHIRRLNLIRRSIPALQKGQYSTDGCGGFLSFKRRFTDASRGVDSFALVTISGGATFTGVPNGTYKDAVTGGVINAAGGTLTCSCSGKGNMRVYVLELSGNPAPGKIGDNGTYLK